MCIADSKSNCPADFDFSERDLMYGTRIHTNSIGNIHDHLSSKYLFASVLKTIFSFHILLALYSFSESRQLGSKMYSNKISYEK